MMRYCSLTLNPPRRSPDPSTFLPGPASKISSHQWPILPNPASKVYSRFFSDFSHKDETSPVTSLSYDVFVSSNGVDKFAVELSSALRQLGFRVFKDEQLTVTNFAPPEVLEAIDRSRVFVVVFSEEYASSTRCLEELAKIMECWKANNQAVVLVFYGVRPSDVWHTEGKFAEKLSRHANSHWRDRVRTWSLALNETAWIVGYEWMESELALIDDVVKDVSRKLYVKDRNKLIGVDSRVRRILSSECLDPSGVHIIGVWGMAGIGKTTIAREIFNMLSVQYESCYILEEFHQMVQRKGLAHLREEFLSKIFEEEIHTISGSDMKQSFMKHRLRNKKVLVVLDDVNDSREVEILVGGLNWFGPGSRVIITSRNRQVLVQLKVKEIYEVERLDNKESLQLFCYYVFEQDRPREDYYGRSVMVINYADGVPFALKVLGSYMWDKGLNWQTTFWRLQQHPPTEIQNIFRRSFDGLDDNEKSIFLDLAFFFVGQHTDYAYRLLDGCGFFTLVGISGLVDKSLITISDGTVVMHNVFKDMGRFLVREENKDPGKRSRLLVPEDMAHVLTKNTGTEAIEGIFLDASNSTLGLGRTVFEKMYNLRLLKIYVTGSEKQGCRLSLSEGLECLPDELRLLHWEYYHLNSLPHKFNPKNLVELNMPCSDLEKLWKGTKNLGTLKKIRLSHSKHLRKIPRLSKAHNLEHVDLEGCISLVKLTSSIRHLDKLVFLNLKDCVKLQYLPATIHLESLEVLNLSGCSELEKIQEISRNLRELYLAGTSIRELPQSIESLSRLSILDLDNCKKLQHIPAGLRTLKSLVVLKTSGFSKTDKFTETTESMRVFHSLDSSNIASKELFPSLLNLADDENGSKSSNVHCNLLPLEELNASFQYLSDLIIFNPASIGRHRIKIMLSSIKVLPTSILHSLASRLHSLLHLYLCKSRVLDIPENICFLCSLKTLDLSRNPFQILPESIRKLSKLQKLCICCCKNLEMLPELPGSLEYLDAHGCTSLESISSCFEQIPSCYIFTNCFKLDPNMLKVFLTRAISRVEQLIKQHQQGSVRSPSFRICLPGTAFWKWIFVRPASSVMIQLSPSERKILLGFAVSVVVTFLDYRNDSGFAIRCICSWTNKKAVSQRLERIFPGCDPRERGPSIREDHMFIYFDPTIFPGAEGGNSMDASGDLIRFEFFPVDQKNNIISSCSIEKCGVYVLTSTNIYTSGASTKRPSSSADSVKRVYGVESGPARKRPRIKRAIEAVIYEIRQTKKRKKNQANNAHMQIKPHYSSSDQNVHPRPSSSSDSVESGPPRKRPRIKWAIEAVIYEIRQTKRKKKDQADNAHMQIKPHYSASDQNLHPRLPSSVPASIQVESSDLFPSEQQRTQQAVDKSVNDGYNWRKYGQKLVKGGMFPLSYYKCTNPGCNVKKKVETSLDGQVTKTIYKGQHNHQFHTGGGFKVKNDDETSQATTERIPEAIDSEEVSDSRSRMRVKDEDEPDAKRRSTEVRVSEAASSSQRTVLEPTVIVQTTSEVDILDDGYRWRKYGQKLILGNPHPRSYYRCLFQGCDVHKHVERAPTDPKALIITYNGKHNHDQAAATTGSHAADANLQLIDDSVNSSNITTK